MNTRSRSWPASPPRRFRFPPCEALKANSASDPAGHSFPASGAAPGYRRGRTRGRAGKCADRHRQNRVFSHRHLERLRRLRESFRCKMARLAEPGLVRGPGPGADDFRCGVAQGHGPTVPGILRSNRRELPGNGADRLPAGGRQSGGAANPHPGDRATGGGDRIRGTESCRKPMSGTKPDSILT